MKICLILIGFLGFLNLASAKSKNQVPEIKRKVAQAVDDCSMNFSDGISALVDTMSNKLSTYIGIAKDPTGKIQMEAVVLEDGRHLVVTSGGCAHIGHSFNYSTNGINSDAQAVDTIIKYLEATPTTQNGKNVKEIWINALRKWKKKPTPSTNKIINFVDGDANLTLRYDNKNLLQIEYDFAL